MQVVACNKDIYESMTGLEWFSEVSAAIEPYVGWLSCILVGYLSIPLWSCNVAAFDQLFSLHG